MVSRTNMPESRAVVECDVLAISSGGGHWVQLMLLRPALHGLRVHYACTNADCAADVEPDRFEVVADANVRSPLRLILSFVQVARLVVRLRPRLVVSTGAAPGLMAILVAAALGRRTVWVESLAGVTRLTLSGRLARPFASRFIVQWPELAAAHQVEYHGSLL
jgi:UDP-N-acetylglucosamine:LPS N-acetylglucosamine transferase